MNNRRIKIAMVTNHLEITGISTVMMNYCKMLNREKYDLTIIAGAPLAEEYRIDCNKFGINLIGLPPRHQKSAAHYYSLWKVLRNNRYDIVHVHGSSSMMAIELTIAKLAGTRILIAHSHNTKCPNMRMHKLLNPYFRSVYTQALACGKLAGEWLFGENNFKILPNGFDIGRYAFSASDRLKIRTKLGIQDKLVVGHIGRINKQKNQTYLLEVFETLAEHNSRAILLLIGTGPDYGLLRGLIEKHPYKERIILYGETKDTPAMYSAMDIFTLPSRYEGLPVVLLEAQISGLPCIVSDKVTKEVDFGNIQWRSIDDDPSVWADTIMNTVILDEREREEYRLLCQKEIIGYDIKNTVVQLENIYDQLLKNIP